VPADQAESLLSGLKDKMGEEGGDKMQAMQDLADEHGVSVDSIQEMLSGDGSFMDKVTGFLDKDGDGSVIDDLGDMAKGFFSKD